MDEIEHHPRPLEEITLDALKKRIKVLREQLQYAKDKQSILLTDEVLQRIINVMLAERAYTDDKVGVLTTSHCLSLFNNPVGKHVFDRASIHYIKTGEILADQWDAEEREENS